MHYGIRDGLTVLVAASDSLVEYEGFVGEVNSYQHSPQSLGIINAEVPSVIVFMTDERFAGFSRAPLVIDYPNEEAIEEFNNRYHLSLLKRNALIKKQEDMLHEAASVIDDPDKDKTIEELYGLDVEDIWDNRTAEEIEQDEQMKKLYDEAKKKGELSGDSFAPSKKKKNKGGVYVTDVHAHTDTDGDTVIDKALVVKKSGDSEKKKKVIIELDSDDDTIDLDGHIAVYHRLDVENAKKTEIQPILEDAGANVIVSRNFSGGCWFAFLTQAQAEKYGKIVEDAGFIIEIYAVNDAGKRMVPKGVEMVDPNAALDEIAPPRPWNDRAKEITAMAKDEKAANWKTVVGKEFYITGNYSLALGTIIYITPKSYFDAKGQFWGKSLNIDHLLPVDFKEVSPGKYASKSRDWNHISYEMARRGFRENMMLQIYLNNL